MIDGLDQPEKTTAYQTVLRAELAHLKGSWDRRRSPLERGFIWILLLIALAAFIWRILNIIPQHPSLLLWLLSKFNLTIPDYYVNGRMNDTLAPLTLWFPLCVLIWDFWLMFRTLAMSANSIARERNGQSWELLLLTGVTPRQIIRAKWWAIVRQQWKNYTLLAIMRIGAISFMALNFNVNLYYGRPSYFSYGSLGPVAEPHTTTVFGMAISIVLLSAALIAVLTILNLMLTAACGIVAGMMTQRPSLILPLSLGVRLLLVVLIAVLAGFPSYLVLKPDIDNTSIIYPEPVLNTISLIILLIGTTMLDSGSIAAGLLIRFGYNVRWFSTFNGFELFTDRLRGNGPAFLTALLLSVGLWVMLTYILLRRAEKIIIQQF